MREAGDVCYADVYRDGSGVVEYLRYDDMKYALRKLDDSKFKSHEVFFKRLEGIILVDNSCWRVALLIAMFYVLIRVRPATFGWRRIQEAVEVALDLLLTEIVVAAAADADHRAIALGALDQDLGEAETNPDRDPRTNEHQFILNQPTSPSSAHSPVNCVLVVDVVLRVNHAIAITILFLDVTIQLRNCWIGTSLQLTLWIHHCQHYPFS